MTNGLLFKLEEVNEVCDCGTKELVLLVELLGLLL